MPTMIRIPQAMQPHGLTGRIFGTLMERMNKSAYARAASLIELPADGGFLEIGFGTGRLIEMMATRAPRALIAGIDPSRLMVETARRRLKSTAAHCDIVEGSAERLPWGADTFDVVAALHCFQFWPDPLQVLAEVHRLLRHDGRFVLILRDHSRRTDTDWLPNPWSRSRNEPEEALMLLDRAGFAAARQMPGAGTSAVILASKKNQ